MRDFDMECGAATRRSALSNCLGKWDSTGSYVKAVRSSRGKSDLSGHGSGRWRIAIPAILTAGREVEATTHERAVPVRDVEEDFRSDLRHFLKRGAGTGVLREAA